MGDKMVTTHLQHNTQPHRPVSLPEFSQPLDNFRGARTHSNNNFAPNSRQITSRRPTTAVRKQPVQFFNKFDDGGLDNSQQLQQQDVQQPPTFTSSQTPRQGKASTLDNNFGSFPSRLSQSSLPSRQTVSRPPVQQLQQQPSDQLPSFTRFTSNQQSQTQQINNFQPQQQNSFQPQQQQTSFQPQPQQTRLEPQQQQTPQFQPQPQQTHFQPQQQQTPQFQPQQQTQSVEDAYKAQQEGIQRVLRQQAEVLALQQRPPTLQQPQTFQQPQLQPQVPGRHQHQAQLNKHLAV